MTNTERDIGRLEAVATNLQQQNDLLRRELEELKANLADLRNEIGEIKTLISEIRGGSRVLLFIGGLASGGVGAVMVKWVPILFAR